MSESVSVVSIHPYFRVNEGKMGEFKSLLPQFVEKTATEEGCLYYHFTIKDEAVVFCREGYVSGEAVLAHLDNVGELLGKALEISELLRLELHGSEGELAKLREPLAAMGPEWYVFEAGV